MRRRTLTQPKSDGLDPDQLHRRFRQIELQLLLGIELESDDQMALKRDIATLKRKIADPAERLAALLGLVGEVQPDRLQHYAEIAGRV